MKKLVKENSCGEGSSRRKAKENNKSALRRSEKKCEPENMRRDTGRRDENLRK